MRFLLMAALLATSIASTLDCKPPQKAKVGFFRKFLNIFYSPKKAKTDPKSEAVSNFEQKLEESKDSGTFVLRNGCKVMFGKSLLDKFTRLFSKAKAKAEAKPEETEVTVTAIPIDEEKQPVNDKVKSGSIAVKYKVNQIAPDTKQPVEDKPAPIEEVSPLEKEFKNRLKIRLRDFLSKRMRGIDPEAGKNQGKVGEIPIERTPTIPSIKTNGEQIVVNPASNIIQAPNGHGIQIDKQAPQNVNVINNPPAIVEAIPTQVTNQNPNNGLIINQKDIVQVIPTIQTQFNNNVQTPQVLQSTIAVATQQVPPQVIPQNVQVIPTQVQQTIVPQQNQNIVPNIVQQQIQNSVQPIEGSIPQNIVQVQTQNIPQPIQEQVPQIQQPVYPSVNPVSPQIINPVDPNIQQSSIAQQNPQVQGQIPSQNIPQVAVQTPVAVQLPQQNVIGNPVIPVQTQEQTGNLNNEELLNQQIENVDTQDVAPIAGKRSKRRHRRNKIQQFADQSQEADPEQTE